MLPRDFVISPSWSLGSICWNRFQKNFCRKCIFLFSAFFSRPVLSVLWSTFPGFRLAGCEEKTPLAGNWSYQPTKVPLCQYVQMNHDYHLAKIEHTPEKFSWPCSTKWVPEHTKRSPRSGQGSHHISESSWKEFFWKLFFRYHQLYLLENKNTILETISYSFMWPLEAHIKVFIICITLVMKTYLVKFI